MAKVTSKILNLPEFKAQLANDVAEITLQQRIATFRDNAQPLLGQAAAESFQQTVLYTGLLGGFSGIFHLDVLAHLGFTDDEGLLIADAIEASLFESITLSRVKFRNAKGRFTGPATGASVSFIVTFQNLIDLIASKTSGGTRSSERGEVPWLDWLISGGQVSGYNILYHPTKFSNSDVSISKRAVMQPKSTSWDISAFEKFAEGDNFIDDIFSNINFQKQVNDIISRELASV